MNEDSERWGRNVALERWLEAERRSIYWLAKTLGLTYTAAYYIVIGRNLPRPDLGWRIVELTGIQFEQLYYGARPETQTPTEVGSEGDCA